MTEFVVTYVDSADEQWRKGHDDACRKWGRLKILSGNRYREWNTLKYIFRGIESNMPWIKNVHLIVERPSQVPKWVNKDKVNVVYHNEIIPDIHLPIYNSTGIELFMWKIPGLAEQFIYGNDDMIPINPMEEDDFYDENGIPRLVRSVEPYDDSHTQYQHHLHNGIKLVSDILGKEYKEDYIIKTGHNLNPMLRSTWETLWTERLEELHKSVSPFRETKSRTM